MIEYGLEAHGGGVMILKNPSPSGVMTVKTGGAMILKNHSVSSARPPSLASQGVRRARIITTARTSTRRYD